MAFLRKRCAPAVLLALAGCGGSGSVDNPAQLRFFDALNDTGDVRLYVGGRLYESDGDASISAGQSTGYARVSSGSVSLYVNEYSNQSSSGNNALASLATQNLAEGRNYTALAVISGSTKRIVLYNDTATTTTDRALFRIIDGYPTTSPLYVNVTRESSGEILYPTFSSTSTVSISPGGGASYQSALQQSTDGDEVTLHVYDAAENGVEIESSTATIKSGEPITFFLYQTRSSNDLRIRHVADRDSDD